jgi:hypothetical protein
MPAESDNNTKIVYLDQNKWVQLCRAIRYPNKYTNLQPTITAIGIAVADGRLILPLTSTNIYETHKVNDERKRHDLSHTQCLYSRGFVFRGQFARKQAELKSFFMSLMGLVNSDLKQGWFISDIFIDAFIEWNYSFIEERISKNFIKLVQKHPAEFLYNYLMRPEEIIRRNAVYNWTQGSNRMIERIEIRRTQVANETMEMRRRVYSATLIMDNRDLIFDIGQKYGINIGEMGNENIRRIVEEVPSYFIERELSLRLEAQNRKINENDIRDMSSFTATVPYCDMLIAEKQFINLAKQAGLDKKFGARLETQLEAIYELV